MKTLLLVTFSALVGGGLVWYQLRPRAARVPDAATVVQQVKDTARLETLDVTAYKKIVFTPDPPPPGGIIDDLWNWATSVVRPSRGKAIVFAHVRFALDLGKLSDHNLRIKNSHIWIVLPPVVSHVELVPADTEVIGSTLDSEQTAALFESARAAFERDIGGSAEYQSKARASAERSVAALLGKLGFEEIDFVSELPGYTFD